ncbi:MAG TPA: hypothetical protein VL172_14855 [Kofleriaceae bacterium]|nr:hypothetical protein [Kofleriaceae bacterium]
MKALYLAAALALLGAACNKPSEDDCKAAVARIRKLQGNERDDPAIERAAIRSCRGSASKKSVRCILEANTMEDLKKCEGGLYEKMYGDEPVKTDNPAKTEPPKTPPAGTPPPPPAGTPPTSPTGSPPASTP